MAALRLEKPDRVPVFLYLNPYDKTAWYADDPSYSELVNACLELSDIVYDWYCPCNISWTGQELEKETRPLPDGGTEHIVQTPLGPISCITAPDWRGSGLVKNWICTEEDARRVLSMPDTDWQPDVTEFIRERRRQQGLAVAQATFPDPICCIGMLVHDETLALWTIEHRDLLYEMLDMFFRRLQRALKHCLENDVGPIYYFNGPEYALPPLMSPRDFDEFVVPYDTQLIEMIHAYPGRYVIVHSHGRVNRFLERFADMGTDGLNVLEPPPIGDVILSEAKQRVGDRMCLIGNIQYDDLARSSTAEVGRLVREAIQAGAPGGGFILSPSAYPYERPLPPRAAGNFIEYLRKAREYGAHA